MADSSLSGINNDGVLEGCGSLQPQGLNRLEQAGGQYCPDARYTIRRVPFHRRDGTQDFVMLIRVFYHETKLVETVDGNAFVRRGWSKQRLRDPEKRETRISKGEVSYELEPCTGISYPTEFDEGLIGQFVEAYHRKKQLDAQHSREEVLEPCHLGSNRSRPGEE